MKALKVTCNILGAVGRITLLGLFIAVTFIMDCIGLLISAIANG